ncbi:hypothetical protein OIC43_19720 [Streptomyces sp. NBC_00825]|uniref:hypothetical protein n=1 Tax=unclassified Streptomyces TaxID=2593676 RepID=UPI00224F148A|nr:MULTISPECIES: hypothetical protein [unclassified Streptomyces]WTB55992.1 hypothetical protein OG832_23975 [Streptomyces sp. NBC_00826]WTH91126.1 hypothetical protein OIC43_19720 [Streptomyces sp. NBC_00825]WTH99852.1 hypothetical protein OHA23_19705 [Streptomyces sp. NBC_00822]MCX4865321.1 hypothetical protein [Streptomyces sp. NBC_00906]MCX4896559.1 hypothetical protein [Streptomyces sp. NBC_00892]
MTQSGQGDEQQLPAVRPTHEGVVLPAGGGEPWIPGGPADQAAPAGGQPWGQPWGPQAAHQDPSQQPQHQPQHQPQGHAQGQGAYGQGQYGQGQPGQGQYGQPPAQMPQAQPLPPVQPQPQQMQQPQQPQQMQPPQQMQQQPQPPQSFAQPLPPEAVPGMSMGGDAEATQYIAPVPGGPVPGGLPPESPAESTTFLGHGVPPQQQAYQQQPGNGGDAEATQFIPPVPGGTPYGIRPGAPGDRQPPAEFDNLFRNDEPAGATQQMPRLDPGQHAGQHPGRQFQGAPQYQGAPQAQQSPQTAYQPVGEEPQPPRKKRAHVTLIAAVVVGCAVVGLGAGALLSGGDDKDKDDKQPVAAASSPAGKDPSTQAAADPAKPQAEALDKLLADSNNSRAAVIGAVEKTKSCTDLDQAVTDLKGAAQQRRDLVTRLGELSVDKLPDHARLTASLTKAWQASAAADEHYAAWAAQAKNGKKVCKHGKARTTSETQAATVQSGEASKAKRQASGLWNSIATKYGLTRRAATQL